MKKQVNRKISVIKSLVFAGSLLLFAGSTARAQTMVKTNSQNAFADAMATSVQYVKTSQNTDLTSPLYGKERKQYESLKLMVKMKNSEPDWTAYDTEVVIQGPNGHYMLQFSDEGKLREAKAKLQNCHEVQYVEQNAKASVSTTSPATTSTGGWSWGLERLGTSHFVEELKKVTTSKSIKVAVVDSGIYKHSAYSGRILAGKSMIDSSNNTNDQHGHGTHVTGTIYDTTRGIDIKFIPVKVFDANGSGFSFDMANGIYYAADAGAKVINLSGNLIFGHHEEYLHESIRYAVEKGAVMVVSAGNDSLYVSGSCPADVKEAIVVGAVNAYNQVANFSNKGAPLDVVAPGYNIKSTYYDGGYKNMTGTSMAAPHITGIVTLLRLMYPAYTPTQIERKLKNICNDLYDSGWDSYSGWGIPNLSKITGQPVTSISISQNSASLEVCETLNLTSKLLPSNATNKICSWSSSNPEVASVSAGLVIAKKAGNATITAKSANGLKVSCNITVTAAPRLSYNLFGMKSYNALDKTAVFEADLTSCSNTSGIHYQIQDANLNTVANKYVESSCTVTGLSNQKIYVYRARTYNEVNGNRVYGTWSYRKAFSTAKASTKLLSDGSGVNITIPKITGVKSFDLYLSLTNGAGSYQKLWKVEPGKTYRFTQFQGKPLRTYVKQGTKTFYLVIKPQYELNIHPDSIFSRASFRLQ